MKKAWFVVGLAVFLLTYFPSLPWFPSVPVFAAEEPVTVKGDQIEYFDTLGKVVASGNVTAVHRETKLTCDQATIYMETKDAYLRGRVALAQPGGLLKGEEVIYNFATRKGVVLEAQGQADVWRTRGDEARKDSGSSFRLESGYLTTCDFEKPHSRLQAKEVHVFLEDRVVLRHVVMFVGNVPLFYLPSYTHLLDDKRPRVTMVPGKTDEWGLFLLTAWRLYLHENLQGRVHIDYRERLDLATGVDLKYELPVGGEGVFRTYYTLQRSIQREHFWSRLTSPDDDKPTPERERYRHQLRHRWEMDQETEATLEIHHAQDSTFIKDFFLREFESDQNPKSYFQIIRTAPWYGLTFLLTRRINKFETVNQQLPFLSFSIRPLTVPWLPFLGWQPGTPRSRLLTSTGWQYQSSTSVLKANEADAKEGTRNSFAQFKTEQEISYPARLLRWLSFRPLISFQHLAATRGVTDLSPQFRQSVLTGFDLNTRFSRIFLLDTDFLGLNIHRLRHLVNPKLEYRYQAKPTIAASRFLQSDGLAKSNTLSPSVENKLQTKRETSPGQVDRVDLVRWIPKTTYDLEGPSGSGGRWGNIEQDLELLPYSWMRLESDMKIDPRIGKMTAFNADLVAGSAIGSGFSLDGQIGMVFDSQAGEFKELPWALGVGWRYQRNTSSQLVLETAFNLGPKWRVGLYQAFDVKRFVTETSDRGNRTVKKIYDVPEFEYRLRRDLHEWTVELVYNVQRSQGETFLLLFRLKAFPEMPFEFGRHYHQPKAGKNFARPGEVRD